jgi:hypothetical protein
VLFVEKYRPQYLGAFFMFSKIHLNTQLIWAKFTKLNQNFCRKNYLFTKALFGQYFNKIGLIFNKRLVTLLLIFESMRRILPLILVAFWVKMFAKSGHLAS